MSRGTDYRPEFCDDIRAYFDVEGGKDIENYTDKNHLQLLRRGACLPTMEGFGRTIGVTRMTIWRWANQKDDDGEIIHPDFAEAYQYALDCQRDILIQNGLKGGYAPGFAIFLASTLLKMKDEEAKPLSEAVEFEVVEAASNETAD